MAHKLNDALNVLAGKTAVPCNDKCEYWKFPHLDRACELSDVFSVCKGQPCYEFKPKANTKQVAIEMQSKSTGK